MFKSLQKQEKGIVYFFSGFGSPLAYYLPAIRRFRKQGYTVACFSFKTKAVLGLSVQTLPVSIKEVVDTVSAKQQARGNNLPVIAIGNSMGSVFAWHVAKKVPSISKVVINTGYALISKHIFEDKIGQHWRKKLLQEGIDQAKFHKLISESEPIANIEMVKGKQVLLFMNKDDNVISFEHSKIFRDAMDQHKIDYKYVQNSKMRHGTTIIKNLMGKEIISFIN